MLPAERRCVVGAQTTSGGLAWCAFAIQRLLCTAASLARCAAGCRKTHAAALAIEAALAVYCPVIKVMLASPLPELPDMGAKSHVAVAILARLLLEDEGWGGYCMSAKWAAACSEVLSTNTQLPSTSTAVNDRANIVVLNLLIAVQAKTRSVRLLACSGVFDQLLAWAQRKLPSLSDPELVEQEVSCFS